MPDNPDAQIVALRERLASLKSQLLLLEQRIERHETPPTEARTEFERLGRGVAEAERQIGQWEARHRDRS